MDNTISVVIAMYNGESCIETQVNSILQQTVKCDEIIICDDHSSDSSTDIIERKIDSSIVKLHINDKNIGVTKTFEKCLSLSAGQYVFLSDQDDCWMDEKIKIQLDKLIEMEREYGTNVPLLVIHDATVVDSSYNLIAESLWKHSGYNPINTTLASTAIWNTFTGCCMLMNRALINELLPFPSIGIYHDQWIAMVAHRVGRIGIINKPLIKFVRHSKNSTVVTKKNNLFSRIRLFFGVLIKGNFLKNELEALSSFVDRYPLVESKHDMLLCKLLDLKSRSVFVKKISLGFYKWVYGSVFHSN